MKNLWNKWNSLIFETRLKYIAGTTAIIQLSILALAVMCGGSSSWVNIFHVSIWTIAYFVMRHFEKIAKKYTDD
jgi:hypothetical protein